MPKRIAILASILAGFVDVSVVAKATLDFSATGYSFNPAGPGLNSMRSVTGAANHSENGKALLRNAHRIWVGFPLSGWDVAYAGTSWKSSNWLGVYKPTSAPWVYHGDLGWLYVSQQSLDSLWLWHDELGWIWTNSKRFPYLYQPSSHGWLHYSVGTAQPALLYDYAGANWFGIGHRLHEIEALALPAEGGSIEGRGTIKDGEVAFLVAKPAKGFIFKGWEGDVEGSENPLRLIKVAKHMRVTARFEPLSQGFAGIVSAVNQTTHLTEEEKHVSLIQVAFLGSSALVSVGTGREIQKVDPKVNLLAKAMGLPLARADLGDFGRDSAILDHPYLPWVPGWKNEVDLKGYASGTAQIEALGTEYIDGVDSLVVETSFPKEATERRWFAQDTDGNIWLLKEREEGRANDIPFLFLPAKVEPGWKSWTDSSAIPKTYVALGEWEVTVRLRSGSFLGNCLQLLVHSPHRDRIEYFAEGKGLVRIE
jgi:hypothetical protein